MTTVGNINSRLSEVEIEHAAMRKDWIKGRGRLTAAMPDMNALRITDSPTFKSKGRTTMRDKTADDDSFTNVSGPTSEVSLPTLGTVLSSMKESEIFGKSDMLKAREMISDITDTRCSPEP
jgi:hypothetical protein